MVARDFDFTPVAVRDTGADARLRESVRAHLPAVWRMLRRHGIRAGDADDGAQKVFLVFARKLGEVEPERELAFLLRTAINVAAEMRRSIFRRREVEAPQDTWSAPKSQRPDEALEKQQAIARVDAMLAQMEPDLRSVFLLYEIEEMTMASIADVLELPTGTVASRLRRAREQFETLCERSES